MGPLPPPAPNQAYCEISAIDAGHIFMHLDQLIDTAKPDDIADMPVLCFLLRHSATGTSLLFDLGIRPDVENLPLTVRSFAARMEMTFEGRNVPAALAQGGLQPDSIAHVVISHVHFDHTGDARVFPNAIVHLGAGAAPLVAALPTNTEESFVAAELPPAPRSRYLPEPVSEEGSSSKHWAPLGPFPRALDLLGDGSAYVVDAPGHVPGHVALLARTSADGAWAFLAGDSAHDWRLVRGEAGIGRHPVFGCMHADVDAARANIERIRALAGMERVRVLLGHDTPWVAKEKETGMKSFWPGKIESL